MLRKRVLAIVDQNATAVDARLPVGTGLIDMPGVVRALKATGYDGILAVESDHRKNNQDEDQLVAQSVAHLKTLVEEIA